MTISDQELELADEAYEDLIRAWHKLTELHTLIDKIEGKEWESNVVSQMLTEIDEMSANLANTFDF